jgi:hypothetical protein
VRKHCHVCSLAASCCHTRHQITSVSMLQAATVVHCERSYEKGIKYLLGQKYSLVSLKKKNSLVLVLTCTCYACSLGGLSFRFFFERRPILQILCIFPCFTVRFLPKRLLHVPLLALPLHSTLPSRDHHPGSPLLPKGCTHVYRISISLCCFVQVLWVWRGFDRCGDLNESLFFMWNFEIVSYWRLFCFSDQIELIFLVRC